MWHPSRWNHRHTVLVLCVIGYFGIRFIEFVLSIVFADIKTALDVPNIIIGLAVAASTLTYAAVQLPSGALGDRFGELSVILASLGLTGIGSLILAASPSGVFIVLGMALIGLVSDAYYTPATALLTDIFDETGRAIGIHRLGAQFVGFTGPLVGLIGAVYNWRMVLLLGAAVAFPALIGFRFFVQSRQPVRPDLSLREQVAAGSMLELFSRPSVAFTTGIAAFAQFVDTATFSFLPLLLREYHDISIELSGVLFTVYFAAVTVGQPVSGWLSDHLGRDLVTVSTLLIGTVGFVLLAAQQSVLLIATAVVLIGLGMGWGPSVQSRAIDHLDDEERGVGFGLIRTVYIGFAALNGIVVMGLVTMSGWDAGIGLLAGLLVLPAIATGVNHCVGLEL